MKLKMLWTGEFDQEGFDRFSQHFDITLAGVALPNTTVADKLKGQSLINALKEADVYLCGYDEFTKEIIDQCPSLKLVMSVRDGPEENIDLKACEEAGIPVISSAGRCAVSVGELTLALMLNLARPIIKMNNYVRKYGWTNENSAEIRHMYDDFSTELFGKTVGILGLGRNGYTLAKLCQAFQMKILATDPYVNAEKMKEDGIIMVDLDTLMESSDYLVTLARVTKETQGIISREKIAKMKKSAVLINTGRGALVDNQALLEALEKNRIKGAALDTHAIEPLGEGNMEFSIDPDKLIITPHMAGKTAERNWHQCDLLYHQYLDLIQGKTKTFRLTPQVKQSSGYAQHGALLFTLKG